MMRPAVLRNAILPTLLLAAAPIAFGQSESKGEPDPLHRTSEAVQALSARISPCVVKILVSGYGPVSESGRVETALIGRQRSIGSGVILDPDGYIVTNAHVVNGAQRVRVALTAAAPGRGAQQLMSAPRGRVMEARIVGVDKVTDLAVLKIEARNLPVLSLASYPQVRQGQIVLAFGTPEGLENTVTMGIVSSVLRQLDPDGVMVYVQTDAAINPGNSGGPLVDIDGNVIGVNTAIFSESGGNEGIGFAIPSMIVRSVYRQIRKFGHVHHYEIGAKLQTITQVIAAGLKLSQDHGVIVADVDPDGPASSSGLRPQDIIVRMNGSAIDSLPMFSAALYLRNPGDSVNVAVKRGEEEVTLKIPVVEQDQDLDNMVGQINPQKALVNRLGILGIEIDTKLANTFTDLRIKTGVVVAAKAAGGTIDAGLESGDVIHQLNTQDVITLDGLRESLNALKSGDPVVLQIERNSVLRYLAFEWE